MTTMISTAFATVAAVAGLAMTSIESANSNSMYDDTTVAKLTRSDVEGHANRVFARADRNGDFFLNADEYTALTIVTAELAHLNGFIVIETGGQLSTASASGVSSAALSPAEQARIEAIARGRFYVFSNDDGMMDQNEFLRAQSAIFDAVDYNKNGVLAKRELNAFAQQHAHITGSV